MVDEFVESLYIQVKVASNQYLHDEKMCTYLHTDLYLQSLCTELGTRIIHFHTVIPVSNLDVHSVIVALRNN